jgi:hypothetical protein
VVYESAGNGRHRFQLLNTGRQCPVTCGVILHLGARSNAGDRRGPRGWRGGTGEPVAAGEKLLNAIVGAIQAHAPALQAFPAQGGDLIASAGRTLRALLRRGGDEPILREPAQHLVDAAGIDPAGKQLSSSRRFHSS